MWLFWRSDFLPWERVWHFCYCFVIYFFIFKLLYTVFLPRISLRCIFKVFSGFFLSLHLSLGFHVHFLIFLYMQLVLNILVFNVWLPKGEKERHEEKKQKSTISLNLQEVTSASGERLDTERGSTTKAAHFFVYISVIRHRMQRWKHRPLIFWGEGS